MNNVKLFFRIFAVLFILGLTGCGGSGSGSSEPGTLSLQMVDATLPGFQAIYVSVDHVDVHPQDGTWMTVLTPRSTVNLLELVNGVQLSLGLTDLAAGPYTQMRLVLSDTPDAGTNLLGDPHPFGNYFISDLGAIQELKVPSGLQTGIKLVNGFTIASGQITELVLDFDAARSVVMAGSSGKFLLKPTIKVVASAATVSGTVTDTTPAPLPGTLVSAQQPSAVATDIAADMTLGSTPTNDQGHYVLYLNPGSYQLVAYRPVKEGIGYVPACRSISLAADQKLMGENFTLEAAAVGSLSGTIGIAAPAVDQFAVLSLRQAAPSPCTDSIELATVNVAADGTYQFDLPVGAYQLVASTEGQTPQVFDLEIAEAEKKRGQI